MALPEVAMYACARGAGPPGTSSLARAAAECLMMLKVAPTGSLTARAARVNENRRHVAGG